MTAMTAHKLPFAKPEAAVYVLHPSSFIHIHVQLVYMGGGWQYFLEFISEGTFTIGCAVMGQRLAETVRSCFTPFIPQELTSHLLTALMESLRVILKDLNGTLGNS